MAESHGQPGAHAIVVWEVLTGQEKRSFSADRSAAVWPALRWSHNDKYFARLQRVERKDGPVETISIYETPVSGRARDPLCGRFELDYSVDHR